MINFSPFSFSRLPSVCLQNYGVFIKYKNNARDRKITQTELFKPYLILLHALSNFRVHTNIVLKWKASSRINSIDKWQRKRHIYYLCVCLFVGKKTQLQELIKEYASIEWGKRKDRSGCKIWKLHLFEIMQTVNLSISYSWAYKQPELYTNVWCKTNNLTEQTFMCLGGKISME